MTTTTATAAPGTELHRLKCWWATFSQPYPGISSVGLLPDAVDTYWATYRAARQECDRAIVRAARACFRTRGRTGTLATIHDVFWHAGDLTCYPEFAAAEKVAEATCNAAEQTARSTLRAAVADQIRALGGVPECPSDWYAGIGIREYDKHFGVPPVRQEESNG